MIFLSLLIWLTAVTIAITIHEFAHALVADRLGDPTARLTGRLSLNPLDHYDRVGTTMLIVSALLNAVSQTAAGVGSPVFGWAKPVSLDPYNLRSPRRDSALIALAGPAANLILAALLAFGLKQFFMELPLLNYFLVSVIGVNVWLAVFNLIPLHPLDGHHLLNALLPEDLAHEYQIIMHQYGFFILMALIIPWNGTSALSTLVSPLISAILRLILF